MLDAFPKMYDNSNKCPIANNKMCKKLKIRRCDFFFIFLFCGTSTLLTTAHDAKDLDDSVLYKIDFETPDFDKHPDLKNQIMTFHTHEMEKYDCVIPILGDKKEEQEAKETELPPFKLLEPLFNAHSCSYRIEAYWSYEICHGVHVRQYHEEREGKNIKFQEYYLGKWNEEKSAKVEKEWQEKRKAGIKYKTTKIDNTKYPYFEMEMTDGTLCDIIDAPRTTLVRYVCYPHGKNEIYSFKETSSCNYEAIILTSALCMIPDFHPDESKEISIKCSNSPAEPHKPLSMLREELKDMQMSEDDFPVSKEANSAAAVLARVVSSRGDRFMLLDQLESNADKFVTELMAEIDMVTGAQTSSNEAVIKPVLPNTPISDLSPIQEFISGKNCLTGGTGWWKYEFCYGRHVRQFHKDKQSETELFLGYFSESAHRQYVSSNPQKAAKHPGSVSIWHHYEKGTHCDRTGQPREVDVKLTCTPISISATTVSMYLLEPKTCVYILVVESPIVCDLIKISDDHGLVQDAQIQELIQRNKLIAEEDLKDTSPKESDEVLMLPENVQV